MMKPTQLLIALALSSVFVSGCTVYTTTGPEPPIAEPAYEPLYYDGYVVYYRDDGVPIYYVGDTVYVVPRTYPRYRVLVGHYHQNVRGYRHWHRSHPHARPHRAHGHRRH